MDTPTIVAITALVTALIALGTIVYFAGVKMSKIELKVDTLWEFQIRRAMGEAVHKGVAEMNSPLTFNEGIKKYLDPLKDNLISFWETKGRRMSPIDALLELEKEFGNDLLHSVCLPAGLSHGACLLLAYSVASQQEQISFDIGH